MKRLSVLRHAKSSWSEPQLDDFDRPLNERGWKSARRMGREFEHRGKHFDCVIASTAARVRETIEGVQEKFDFRAPIRFEPGIYLAGVDTLVSLVRELPDDVCAPLLVGHNPGMHELIIGLSRDDKRGLRRSVAAKFPTAGFAALELPADNWSDIQPGIGEIAELIFPRDLD